MIRPHLQRWFLLSLFALLPSGAQAAFADVDVTHPYFHAIDSLQAEGIVQGYDRGDELPAFQPLRPVLRAEAMKMLTMAADIPLRREAGGFFSDVPNTAWFAPYVNTAAERGIVSGFADGDFHPAAQVSRAEFLKMLTLSFGVPVQPETEDQEWYDRFFASADRFRLLPGAQTEPHQSLTRGEVAELIYRAQYVAAHDFAKRYVFSGTGQASYYNEGFAGRPTASGEIYDPTDLTAAHRTLPFGTYVKVWYEDRFIVVRINDRGPYHSKRILDLSERAFTKLAPVSRGVIQVDFEVVSGPDEDKPPIPEYVRPTLDSEIKNEAIPTPVAEKIVASQGRGVNRTSTERTPTRPLFSETVSHLSEHFFPTATLRRSIPRKVVAGTVIQFAGTAKESGHSQATVFLQKLNDRGELAPQIHFSGPVSGRNFSFPVMFLEAGEYHIGLVFDDDNRSRVEKIEVVNPTRERRFAASNTSFSGQLELNVIPEEQRVLLSWSSGENRLTKLIFSQGNTRKALLVEDGMGSLSLPYDYFAAFTAGDRMVIELSQALSSDGTLINQQTNWRDVTTVTYDLSPGFPDQETEAVSIRPFPRFNRSLDPVTLSGQLLDGRKTLAETAFMIGPDGFAKTVPFASNDGERFRFTIQPEKEGAHVVEVLTDEGEILFNRAMYFSPRAVLPVLPWRQTVTAPTASSASVRHWTNRVRQKYGINRVVASAELDTLAQQYAEQMAADNFISHTSPTGVTFEDRIRRAELQGEYGENLSYATTIALALEGLENSASHRKNMLAQKWRRIGIGVAQNQKDEYYVVQIFGK